MSRKSIIGVALSVGALLLVSGLYTNCQPIGDGFGDFGSNGDPNPGGGLPTDGSTLTKAQDLWVNSVYPLISTSCNSCHAAPRFAPETPGPLSIFNYELMKAMASAGPRASDNAFINKPRGINHGGGNQCGGDVNGSVSPCKEIKEWIVAEFPLLSDGKAGIVSQTDLIGRVKGWVANPADTNTPVQAILYIGGPVGVGVLAGEQLANLNVVMGAPLPNTSFNIQLPEEFNDGVIRDLYVYAETAVADNLIPSMPVRTQSFIPSAEAEFIANVRGNLQRCNGCHGAPDYMREWNRMGSPTPLEGGTATNNELINYMNGENNHSGGGFCGGNKNAGICANVRDWWIAEFGQ